MQPLLVAAAATAPKFPLEFWSWTTVKVCVCRGNTHTLNVLYLDPLWEKQHTCMWHVAYSTVTEQRGKTHVDLNFS